MEIIVFLHVSPDCRSEFGDGSVGFYLIGKTKEGKEVKQLFRRSITLGKDCKCENADDIKLTVYERLFSILPEMFQQAKKYIEKKKLSVVTEKNEIKIVEIENWRIE